MGSNPRKFSEKIALHNQKQMEETAAFEKIMREVSHATSKVNTRPIIIAYMIELQKKLLEKQTNDKLTIRLICGRPLRLIE